MGDIAHQKVLMDIMAKGIEIMAKRKGLSTSFDSPSESARSKRTDQQN